MTLFAELWKLFQVMCLSKQPEQCTHKHTTSYSWRDHHKVMITVQYCCNCSWSNIGHVTESHYADV